MKFTATLLTFLGATSLVAAAPLDISSSMPGPEGLAKRQAAFCSEWEKWKCIWDAHLYPDEDGMTDAAYKKCMDKKGCWVPPGPIEPPVVETIDKRDAQGLAKRQYDKPGCGWVRTKCGYWTATFYPDDMTGDAYKKCVTDKGCLVLPGPTEPPAVEAIDKRDSQDHCGFRNHQCQSQAELAGPGANVTEIYHDCMEEHRCKLPTSLETLTTETLLTKRWHPHCGAWQATKCQIKAERPSRWGDPNADVKEEWRACMIDNNCACAIDYPYYCDEDNS